MSKSPGQEPVDSSETLTHRADEACDRFEAAWKAGQHPRIEDHLAAVAEAERSALLCELILLEIDYRHLAGDQPRAEEFLARFPALDRAWITGVLSGAALPLDPGAAGGAGAARRLGKYLLLQQLGKGGCGTVWRAHDTELDRVVALKIPDAALIATPLWRERFRREARAVAQLSHPNIVTLFGVDQIGGTPLLVMEYVDGTDLGRLVEESGPLPVRQACDCIRQAALGLQHAHERGLIHRDVKPSNLLLSSRAAVVKVVDLGLVRLPRRVDDPAASLTEPGYLMGTADFLAPEQARDASNADARADVYSLGCTLYYLLTARVPFPGGTVMDKLLRHVSEKPPPVEQLQPAVSPELAAVVRTMMAYGPADRYQTAAAVAAALSAVLDTADQAGAAGSHPAAPPASGTIKDTVTLTGRPRRPGPRRWHLVVLLLALAALVAISVLQPWNWLDRSDQSAKQSAAELDAGKPEPNITNSIDMKLVLIPAGEFQMGSPEPESRWIPTEGPRHKVVLTRAFYMGVYEVTQRQFEAVMGYNPSHFTKDRGGGPDHPVEQVSYLVAVAFCERLSARPAEKRAGRVYRLPTEAEWEYACRAGTTTKYYFGDDANELWRYAWFVENAGDQTHQVGQRLRNAWGLYDMYGNVWEWCADWYDPKYYEKSPENAKDPCCSRPPKMRVLRGGGWGGEYSGRQWCRSAARGRQAPGDVTNLHGLRVVFTVPSAP